MSEFTFRSGPFDVQKLEGQGPRASLHTAGRDSKTTANYWSEKGEDSEHGPRDAYISFTIDLPEPDWDAGKALSLGEMIGYVSVDQARALRDALDKALGDHVKATGNLAEAMAACGVPLDMEALLGAPMEAFTGTPVKGGTESPITVTLGTPVKAFGEED